MTISACDGTSRGCETQSTKATGSPRKYPASKYSSILGGKGAEAHHMEAGSPPNTTAAGIRSTRSSWAIRSCSAPPLWRCQCTRRVRSSTFCKRYIPTLRTPVCGSRVITWGKVMNCPPSFGQHLRMGSVSNEASVVWMTSWTAARRTFFGAKPIDFITSSKSCPRSITSRIPLGKRGSINFPKFAAKSSKWSTPNAIAIRSADPNPLMKTGISEPVTFSNNKAGLFPGELLLMRWVISVISNKGETGSVILFICPDCSSNWIKSLRFSIGMDYSPGRLSKVILLFRFLVTLVNY